MWQMRKVSIVLTPDIGRNRQMTQIEGLTQISKTELAQLRKFAAQLEKRKDAHSRYAASKKGQAARSKYQASTKAKESRSRWRENNKAKLAAYRKERASGIKELIRLGKEVQAASS